MRLLILGAGGHAQVIADAFLTAVRNGQPGEIVGFLDDDPALQGLKVLGIPVCGVIADLPHIKHDAIIVGIGSNSTRRRLFDDWRERGERFVSVIHPRTVIADGVVVGEGAVICAGVVVNTGSNLGCNIILNTASSVDHHNVVGDHAHIGPGVHLGGDVTIGAGALIGIGAIVMPQRSVGAWSVVGAGALVRQPVPDATTVAGVPARPLADKRRAL